MKKKNADLSTIVAASFHEFKGILLRFFEEIFVSINIDFIQQKTDSYPNQFFILHFEFLIALTPMA